MNWLRLVRQIVHIIECLSGWLSKLVRISEGCLENQRIVLDSWVPTYLLSVNSRQQLWKEIWDLFYECTVDERVWNWTFTLKPWRGVSHLLGDVNTLINSWCLTESKYGEYSDFEELQFRKFELRETEMGYTTILLLLCPMILVPKLLNEPTGIWCCILILRIQLTGSS